MSLRRPFSVANVMPDSISSVSDYRCLESGTLGARGAVPDRALMHRFPPLGSLIPFGCSREYRVSKSAGECSKTHPLRGPKSEMARTARDFPAFPLIEASHPAGNLSARSQDCSQTAVFRGTNLTHCEPVDIYWRRQWLALHVATRLMHPERNIREQFPFKALALVAILVLALLGGLLHQHKSASDADACSYCHAGIETPVLDLGAALVATNSAVVGFTTPARPSRPRPVVPFSTLVPRAPPATTYPVIFWEGCAGLA
jgi:hypothetical protein